MGSSGVAFLELSHSQRRQLQSIRRRAAPYEACAILLGVYRAHGTRALVKRVVEMENTDESTSEFAVDPEHQYQVLEAATRDRLEQVGIFHSHPAPPYPSTRDLQFMEHNPCVWIIDGIQNQRHAMKAYQLLGGRLHDVPIRMLS